MAKKPAGRSKESKTGQSKATKKAQISFDFIKSNQFRVVHVDGAFGGASPNSRFINMAVYSERRPIPKTTYHPITDNGLLGPEDRSKRDERVSMVREVEAELVMDLPTAMVLRDWLDDKINQLVDSGAVMLVDRETLENE